MAESLRASIPDQGRGYLRLARDVQSFLEARGLESWGALDVETFVFVRAEDMPEAVAICCDLAAMLPYLIDAGDLSTVDATAFWVALYDVCPEDEVAQRYLLEGLARFGDLEALVRAQLVDWEDERGTEHVAEAPRPLSVVS